MNLSAASTNANIKSLMMTVSSLHDQPHGVEAGDFESGVCCHGREGTHVETQFLKKILAYVWATTTFAPAAIVRMSKMIAGIYTKHGPLHMYNTGQVRYTAGADEEEWCGYTPAAPIATGACSLDDPHPKFSPPMTIG